MELTKKEAEQKHNQESNDIYLSDTAVSPSAAESTRNKYIKKSIKFPDTTPNFTNI